MRVLPSLLVLLAPWTCTHCVGVRISFCASYSRHGAGIPGIPQPEPPRPPARGLSARQTAVYGARGDHLGAKDGGGPLNLSPHTGRRGSRRGRAVGRAIAVGFLRSKKWGSRPHQPGLDARRKKADAPLPAAEPSEPAPPAPPGRPGAGQALRERVLLVDGTGLAYRCFFALPTLTTYRGTEIGAIVGFMNSLARLYRTFGPKYVGIAFDSPGANNSKREVWPEYKANRPVIKSSFKKQLMWIKEFCAIVGLPVFLRRTTEADDIISSMINFLRGSNAAPPEGAAGGLEVQRMRQFDFRVAEGGGGGGVFDRVSTAPAPGATRLEPLEPAGASGLEQRRFEVYVLTADKDLLQVLEHNVSGNVHVRVVQPHKKFRVVDEETVFLEYGIPPSRFSEYLALVGDSADNIPGVMGIGPKTAPVLIGKYGSFKDIIGSAEIAKIVQRSEKHSMSVEKAFDFHLITKLRNDVPVLSSIAQLCKKRTLERQFVEFCKMFSLQKCSLRWHDVTH